MATGRAPGNHKGFALPYLRAWREWRVLTQAELAKRAKASKTTITRIESAHQTATATTIGKLAGALGITPEQLVRQEPSDDLKTQGAA